MTNQQSTRLQRTNGATTIKIFPAESLFDRMKEIYQSVAHRAHKLFEGRGREHGHDLEDWFRAEAELLFPVPVEVSESGNQIKVRAEVPGFSAKDLALSVESHRLIISGKTEQKVEKNTKEWGGTEVRSGEIFCALALSAEIDPAKMTAKLQDGVLELFLPKARSQN